MKGRTILIVAVVVVVILIVIFVYESSTSTPVNKAWLTGPEYPLNLNGGYAVAGQQCVNSTGYIFCVGGLDIQGGPRSEVYSAEVPQPGSGNGNLSEWSPQANKYPLNINGQSCVAASRYTYCVGGSTDAEGDDTTSSYFAQLTQGVVGNWTQTTPYPIAIDTQSCVTSTGYIYCVGGNNETDGTYADSTPSSSVWYAQLSASGIGAWSRTTSYPTNVYLETCYQAGGFIYCLGGVDGNGNSVNTDYYAPLTPSGVGTWAKTTAYPQQLSFPACVISSGMIYCVGGETSYNSNSNTGSYTSAVYVATISSSGIGSWKSVGGYPDSSATDCVATGGVVYCVGGLDSSSAEETGAVYYAQLTSFS